jgi:hypothetical protein
LTASEVRSEAPEYHPSQVIFPGGRSRECWLALLFFTALTLLLTYPLSMRLGSASLGSDPDVHTFTWTLGWDVHALTTRPWAIFDANIFFPYRRTLAFSENLIGSAFVAAPVVWVTGNYVLAMNLVAVVSVALCGLGAYVLARQLGLSIVAAVVCGLVFAFSPARFFRFAQIHLVAIQWIPFTLAAMHAYVDHGRPRDLRLAIAFFTLQALASLHGAVFLVLAVAAFSVAHLITGTPMAIERRIRDMGIPGGLLAMPALASALPYLQVQKEMGLVRTLENWIPTPDSFLASLTHLHMWVLARFIDPATNERASAFLFPGYLPILLTVVGLLSVLDRSRRRSVVVYGLLTIAALVLSVGPPFSIWPHVYWLPVLNFIRIPSRFFLVAMLGIAVLSAVGVDRIVGLAKPRTQRLLGVATCVALLVEFAAMPLRITPFTVEFAAVDRWLATRPGPFAIAEVPVGPSARYHSTYMLHSMAHWHSTVHAHTSLQTELHERLYDRLRAFPDEASLQALSDIGVTYIVVHTDMYQPGEWPVVEAALSRYGSRLAPEYTDDTGRVYRLQR